MIGASSIDVRLPVALDRTTENAASRQRFQYMVEAHFDFIWRALKAMGVEAGSVDDAAQHVYFIAYTKLDGIAEGSERAFLFRTALGVARNARRSQARARARVGSQDVIDQPDQLPDPEQLAGLKQARAMLDEILAGMADDLRVVFVSFELEGLETKEIAELLGIAQGTVASRLRRARKVFQSAAKRAQARSERPR
jgi:RNA polymerase sigma-70 factor (ECF subfamily)